MKKDLILSGRNILFDMCMQGMCMCAMCMFYCAMQKKILMSAYRINLFLHALSSRDRDILVVFY